MTEPSRPRLLHLVTRDARRGAESAGLALHEALIGRGWVSEIRALAPAASGGSLGVPALGAAPLNPGTLARLRRLAGSVDLVIAHGSSTLPAAALALVGSTPFVYVNIGDPLAWQTTVARRARIRALLRRTRAVVTLCERSADTHRDMLGVDEGRIHVIPNFRSSTRFRPWPEVDRRAVRAECGIPDGAPLALFLGALSAEKRPDVAISAVASLSGVHLVIAGDGPLADAVVAQATELEVLTRIHPVGSVAEPEGLLAAADVIVLSSDTEGVPGVLIEAGLSGTPAAATAVGFVDEVVVDGETGRTVPRGDPVELATAIVDVLAERERYGSAAREFCLRQFEEQVVVDRWEALLDRVLTARP